MRAPRSLALSVAPVLVLFSVVGFFDPSGPSLPQQAGLERYNPVNETVSVHKGAEEGVVPKLDETKNQKQAVRPLKCNEVNLDIVRPPNQRLGEGERILVLGLCKTGTVSLNEFFGSAGYRACHNTCVWNGTDGRKTPVGRCMRNAIAEGKPPMKSCGDFQVYTDLNLVTRLDEKDGCYFPQIQALEELHEEDPDATIILNMRDPDNWAKSVQKFWDLGTLLPNCEIGPASGNSTDLKAWYCEHVQRIRTFAANHPSHAFVEVDIEAPNVGQRLADLFGVNASHWQHKNNNFRTGRKKSPLGIANASANSI